MDLIKVILRSFIKYTISFKKSTLFILGLIWSFKILEKTLLNILIARLATEKMKNDLPGSVVVVNLHELITIVYSAVVAAYVTDVYGGRLKPFVIVVFSATVCIGLIGNYVEAGNDDKGQLDLQLFFPVMVVMALTQAVLAVTLKAFLDDQFRQEYCNDYERREHTKFWWTLVSSSAAIFGQVGLTRFHLNELSQTLSNMMLYSLFLFLLGFEYYYDNREYIHDVTSIAKVNRPVNILPLWICLSILSLVSASGSAFFLFEAITLAGRDYLPVILLLDNVTRFTSFVVSESSSLVLEKLKERKRFNQQKMELLRIGIGMWCCVLCCNFAVGVSTHRKYGAGGEAMSVYWLIPQFFLLGFMLGLAKDGFQSLYESQASSRWRKYGWALGELARGAGSLMSILCVFIFRGRNFRWLEKNIESSSLNKYYSFLAVLSIANAMFYCCIAAWYLAWPFLRNDRDKRPRATDSRMETPQTRPFLDKDDRDKQTRVTHTIEAKVILVKDRDKRPREERLADTREKEAHGHPTVVTTDKGPKDNNNNSM